MTSPSADELLAVLADKGRDAFLDACFGHEVINVELRQNQQHPTRGHIIVSFRTLTPRGEPAKRPDRFKVTLRRALSHSRTTRNSLRTSLSRPHAGSHSRGRYYYPVGHVWREHADDRRRGTFGDEQLLDAFREALLDAAFEHARAHEAQEPRR